MLQPIRGTWLNLGWQDHRNDYTNPPGVTLDAAAWTCKVEELAELGMYYLIIMNVADRGRAFFETELLPPAWDSADRGPVEAVLAAADRLGLKVFLGAGWAGSQDDQFSDPHVLPGALALLSDATPRLSGHPSFAGWYLPCEACITPRFGDDCIEYVNTLARAARALAPAARILISPYGLSLGAEIDDAFVESLRRLEVDVIAYQDEVGCVRVDQPLETMRAGFERLRWAHDQVPALELWANVETFTWTGEPNRESTSLVPAALPRLLSQLAAVSPVADTVVSFIVQGLLDKPGSPYPLGQPECSQRLWRDYNDWLDGAGRWPLLVQTLRPECASENEHDARWRPLTAPWTVDLGRTRLVQALAARFLQFAPAGIRLPRRVIFEVSEDGEQFREVGAVTLDGWPNDLHDHWIDVAHLAELHVIARLVRLSAEGEGVWTEQVLVG